MSDFVAGLFIGLIGGLLLLGSLFGAYNYLKLSRIPVTHPVDATTGETITMEVTVADETPTVEAPFSKTQAALVYWQIHEFEYDQDGSDWALLADGMIYPELIRTEYDTYDISVELPSAMSGRDIPNAGGRTTVETSKNPPEHILQFERDNGLTDSDSVIGGKQRRQYRENRFETGDEITVYGRVEPTSGDFVAGDRFKLTPGGTRFMITREHPSKTKKKRAIGALAAFALSIPFLRVAVSLL